MEIHEMPKSIKKQYEELVELMNKDSKSLSVDVSDAAKVLGMDAECLRAAASQGNCPFVIGGDRGANTSRFTKSPKLAMWNFMLQGKWQF